MQNQQKCSIEIQEHYLAFEKANFGISKVVIPYTSRLVNDAPFAIVK